MRKEPFMQRGGCLYRQNAIIITQVGTCLVWESGMSARHFSWWGNRDQKSEGAKLTSLSFRKIEIDTGINRQEE